jgi:3-hydroxyacyl-CoA dehydrogenase/enoyl-CoA hydratase/3-hydroxybutyryl-CoA epimerase
VPSPELRVDADGLAQIVFDAPDRPVNVLETEVMDRLTHLLAEVRGESEAGRVRGVLVRSGKPASFVVGADLDAIAAIDTPEGGAAAARFGQQTFVGLAKLPVPTVAAIHGTCLGGGTELALACRHRVASDAAETKIGLPEVQLGILPAWGGTSRLPRLIGLAPALEILLTGNPVSASKAKRLGLVTEVLPHDRFLELALAFLQDRVRDGAPPPPPRRPLAARMAEALPPGRSFVLSAARRNVMERTGGHYPAPLRIIEAVGASLGRTLEEALEIEAGAAGDLIGSRISRNLIHVFRLREGARKGLRNLHAEPADVSNLGIVGAGTMGGGIAQLAAVHGVRVRMKDVKVEAVALALRHAAELVGSAVEKGRLTRREADASLALVSGGTDYSGFAPSDLVVEAVVERMDVKRSVFQELEREVGDACVLATNTSSLSVAEMATALKAPGRLVGMHFFNPVHRMPLVEVVRAPASDDRAIATVFAFSVRMGKVPVVVRDGPGFLVNRVLGPYLNEGGHLLGDGATIEAIDEAMTEFGMPMGPLRLVDEVGIDVVRHAGASLHAAFGERLAPAAALTALAASGRLGKKGGVGFYAHPQDHTKGDEKAAVDPSAYAAAGVVPRAGAPGPEEIRDRLVLAMVNEAARALADGIVSSAADADLAMIMGTGFPPFRGGLLRYADDLGARSLVERLHGYESRLGVRFAPAPFLQELAKSGKTFYESVPGGSVQ